MHIINPKHLFIPIPETFANQSVEPYKKEEEEMEGVTTLQLFEK